jgi:hypothetical protein
MAQIGTTSIDSLPIANVDVASHTTKLDTINDNNVILEDKVKQLQEQRKELERQPQTQQQQQQPNMNVNEFVSGIQKASSSGALQLQSRDIPQDTMIHTNDQQVQSNYVPVSNTNDYITEHQTTEEILRINSRKNGEAETLDKIYSEISLPLMVAVFYFLYQLPIVRKTLLSTFPMCYTKTGDMNMSGFILNSSLFGLAIYGTHKFIKYLS